MATDDDIDPLALIVELRGGYPETCSFCGKKPPPEELIPEEAGDWACEDCVARWEKEEGGWP